MTTQEQAFINGFVKRASEYGYNENTAIELYKHAVNFPSNMVPNTPGSLAAPFGTAITGGNIPESLKYNPGADGAGSLSGMGFGAPVSMPATPVSMPSRESMIAAQPTAPKPKGPSDAFLGKVMGSYNKNSRVDQAQAQRIREMYQPGITAKQIYADPRYKINREAYGAPKGANRRGYRGI